jgi:hypothetical protein
MITAKSEKKLLWSAKDGGSRIRRGKAIMLIFVWDSKAKRKHAY